MRISIAHKILGGYLAGFILLLGFAGLTLYNGKRIEATTQSLAQQKLPGLIAATNLKTGLQVQKNHLYELYAAPDKAAFDQRYQQDTATMQKQLTEMRKLPEYLPHDATIKGLIDRQQTLAASFSTTMGASEVDWDSARAGLAMFSTAVDEMAAELDQVVQQVEADTLSSADASQHRTQQLMTVSLTITAAIFCGVLAMIYFTTRQVTTPLKRVSTILGEIAASRDMTRRLDKESDDEVGDIASAVNHLLAEFQQLAKTLDRTAQDLGVTVQTMNRVTEATHASVLSQNEQLHAADGAANEIAAQVITITEKVALAATEAHASAQASEQGREVVVSSRNSIAKLALEVESTSVVITKLEEDSKQVSGVLAIIRDIADQTNLLALNAAIEAARAGEAGRGFAVVADEVRKLSQSTGNATTEIDQIMANLRGVAQNAAQLMQQARSQADVSVGVANDAEAKLHAIQDAAQSILGINRDIDAVTRDHQTQVQAIRSRMAVIESGTGHAERNVGALQDAATELAALADNLRGQISQIRF
jgi:methyl-accepting chemotaxis protein